MKDDELYELIISLINSKREDAWWDFKQEHHHDKAALVHDIICMANNKANKDAYLIIGVEDGTYNIVGVENDVNRRNQQMITDLLRHISFAGGVRPRVEERTILIAGHQVDVIIIKNSYDVPYYLEKEYRDKKYRDENGKTCGIAVRPYLIYTRVVDNNTPIDQNADINDVEYLWKKRFGLLDTPLQLVNKLLLNPSEWQSEDDNVYYNVEYPQFTVKYKFDEDDEEFTKDEKPELYHLIQCDTRAHYGMISVFHYTTKIFSWQISDLDGFRAVIPIPEKEFVRYENSYNPDIFYRYYCRNSLPYILLTFLNTKFDASNGKEASIAIQKLMEITLLFEDKEEAQAFSQFISQSKTLVKTRQKEVNMELTHISEYEVENQRLLDAYTLQIIKKKDWKYL